jgi:hypothetical protein
MEGLDILSLLLNSTGVRERNDAPKKYSVTIVSHPSNNEKAVGAFTQKIDFAFKRLVLMGLGWSAWSDGKKLPGSV